MKINIQSITELVDLVKDAGFTPSSIIDREDLKQVGTKEGAVVNWFPSTGTISFQGEEKVSKSLARAMEKLLQDRGEVPLTFD